MPKGAFTLHSGGATTPVLSTRDNIVTFTLCMMMSSEDEGREVIDFFCIIPWHHVTPRVTDHVQCKWDINSIKFRQVLSMFQRCSSVFHHSSMEFRHKQHQRVRGSNLHDVPVIMNHYCRLRLQKGTAFKLIGYTA